MAAGPFGDTLVDAFKKHFENVQSPDDIASEALSGLGITSESDSVTMPDGSVLDNPYKLNSSELHYLLDYLNGKFYWTNSDKRAAEAAYQKYQQYLQWYNENQNNRFEVDWNSETNQIPREMDASVSAGLNPDLVGLSGGAAADMSSSDLRSAPPAGQSDFSQMAESVSGLFGSVSNIIAASTGIGSLVLQHRQVFQSLRNSRAEYAGKLLNDILPGVVSSLPESAFDSDESFSAAFNEDLFTGLGFSRSDYIQSKKWLDSLKRSPSQLRDLFSNKYEYEKFRQGYGELLLSPFRWSESGDNELLGRLQSLKFEQMISLLDAQIAMNRYQSSYYGSVDPSLAADAFDSTNRQSLNAEQLQDLQLDFELARMRVVLPQILEAASLIESGDPANMYVGQTILADVVNPSNSVWSQISRLVVRVPQEFNDGDFNSYAESFFGTSGSGSDDGTSFAREVYGFISSLARGDFANASFYGISYNSIKSFFQGVDSAFADGWNRLRDAMKESPDLSRPSHNPIDTPLDSFNHFR